MRASAPVVSMTEPSEYGRALFLLSEEERDSDRVREDLRAAVGALSENPAYVGLLDTPALSREEKESLIDGAFSALSVSVTNLLKILSGKHAVYILPHVQAVYDALYEESRGIVHAEAVTAVPMTEEQTAAMTVKLSEKTGKTVILHNTVDPSILGGVRLRMSGTQTDTSLATRLADMERAVHDVIL